MKHEETAPLPNDKAAGPRGRGRGRDRVTPAWMTNRAGPNRPPGLPESHEERRAEGEIGQQGDGTRTTADDDGETRRDDTKTGNSKGDDTEDEAGPGLGAGVGLGLGLGLYGDDISEAKRKPRQSRLCPRRRPIEVTM
jgi:hypothetical protein